MLCADIAFVHVWSLFNIFSLVNSPITKSTKEKSGNHSASDTREKNNFDFQCMLQRSLFFIKWVCLWLFQALDICHPPYKSRKVSKLFCNLFHNLWNSKQLLPRALYSALHLLCTHSTYKAYHRKAANGILRAMLGPDFWSEISENGSQFSKVAQSGPK